MNIVNITNGGVAATSEEQAKALIATGSWKELKPKRTTAKKTAPKQEPEEEK